MIGRMRMIGRKMLMRLRMRMLTCLRMRMLTTGIFRNVVDYGDDDDDGNQSACLASCPQNFHETAYSADCMEDLLSAMNEFIDDSVVLPAGNWDKDLLLPILRTQNMKMRQRRKLKDALEEEEEEEEEAEDLIQRETTEVDCE